MGCTDTLDIALDRQLSASKCGRTLIITLPTFTKMRDLLFSIRNSKFVTQWPMRKKESDAVIAKKGLAKLGKKNVTDKRMQASKKKPRKLK